jgi:hypothetical protein
MDSARLSGRTKGRYLNLKTVVRQGNSRSNAARVPDDVLQPAMILK